MGHGEGEQDVAPCCVGPSGCWLHGDAPAVLQEGFPIPPRTVCSLLLPGNERDRGGQRGQTCWEMYLLLGRIKLDLYALEAAGV